jgi:DNA-binding CsgD family transcriptional regulator/hemerythrin
LHLDITMITLTGHAEIDQQHELLENALGRLAVFCTEATDRPDITCDACNTLKQKHCRTVLSSIAGDLGATLAGHSAYEEKMMELLPPTPSCQSHVKAHKAAHEGIAKQLKKFSGQVADGNSPRQVGDLVLHLVGEWLRDHSNHFDARLVSLGSQASRKIDFDSELVAMLDRHVFPNRPVKAKGSLGPSAARGTKLEVRGRFESLSPAQRSVFWLVVGGRSNPEIAGELGISVNTVKTHRAVVFQKMDVTTALELVKKADVLR